MLRLVDPKCQEELLQIYGAGWNNAALHLGSHCHLLVVSRVLSVVAMTLGTVLKVPQIAALLKAGSAKGISLSGLALETFNLSVLLLYHLKLNNPLSVYAECFALWGQDILLLLLAFGLNSFGSALVLVFATVSANEMVHAAGFDTFGGSYIPLSAVTRLFYATLPLGWLAMLLQIHQNFVQKSTGNLSPVMLWMGWTCGLLRLGTILIELRHDVAALLGNSVNNVLGTVLLFQYYRYRTKIKRS